MTTCRKCGVTDPACGFYDREKRCKDCRRAAMRALYGEHNARPVTTAEARRQREARWRRRGIIDFSVQRYEQMYDAQHGRCAICRDPHDRLHVDHDHATGQARALLCRPCNTLLGLARESAVILAASIEYLEYHSVPEGHPAP